MRITLIKTNQNGIKTVEMSGTKLLSSLALAACTLVAIIAVTVLVTRWSMNQNLVSETAIYKWNQELLAQKSQLVAAKTRSEEQIQALSSRLATLQAHLYRLDALGNRVANDMGLSDEFSFEQSPALGGVTSPFATAVDQDDVALTLAQLENSISSKEQQLAALESLVFDKDINIEQKISGRPVKKGWLSSPFGRRADPFTGKRDWHPGVDFAALSGSDVVATAAGVVTDTGRKSGYGQFVEVSHGDGYVTRYAHNKELLVAKGDMVKKGQAIAKVGNTGRSTGPHVHYEIIKNGTRINPYHYLKK